MRWKVKSKWFGVINLSYSEKKDEYTLKVGTQKYKGKTLKEVYEKAGLKKEVRVYYGDELVGNIIIYPSFALGREDYSKFLNDRGLEGYLLLIFKDGKWYFQIFHTDLDENNTVRVFYPSYEIISDKFDIKTIIDDFVKFKTTIQQG